MELEKLTVRMLLTQDRAITVLDEMDFKTAFACTIFFDPR
jgi:hypothetical protein